MRILHVVPGLNEPTNGIAVAAKLIAAEQSKAKHEVEVIDTQDFVHSNTRTIEQYSEIWVHSIWLPQTIRACWRVVREKEKVKRKSEKVGFDGPRFVRMTHANLDPVRLKYHGWKKRLVAPIERWLFKRTDRVVVTCEAEKNWCQKWGLKNEFEVLDLKKFFDLDKPKSKSKVEQRNLYVLYLGRRHPLKGVGFLERAVDELNQSIEQSNNRTIDLRIVSNHFGEELAKDWERCDVLCLPSLSENFGLVVAEALEKGKKVITTDGAPAWAPPEVVESKSEVVVEQWRDGLLYLKGFRDGTDEERVRLLKSALKSALEEI